jgi:hypothetical protein
MTGGTTVKLFSRQRGMIRIVLLVCLFVGLSFWVDSLYPKTYYPEKIPNEEISEQKDVDPEQPQIPSEKQKSFTRHQYEPMKLEPQKEENDTAPELDSYSLSLKKDSNERQITPAVSITPGKGVNVKLPGKDETIELEKDHSYSSDYQVVWKKKF